VSHVTASASYLALIALASLDESYLDITDYCANNEMSVDDAVAQLRKQVKETTGLTVSCGVAPNLSEACCLAVVFSLSRACRSAGQDLL